MKISLLSITTTFVLALTVPSVFGVPLFRNGNASKPCPKIRTPKDYDDPVDGIIPANLNKGLSLNSNRKALFSQTKVWTIDSEQLTTCILNPVNDKGSHWSLTLTQPTNIDDLLDEINNAEGWTKIS